MLEVVVSDGNKKYYNMLVNDNVEVKHENGITTIYLENNENLKYTFVNNENKLDIAKSIVYILTKNKISFIYGSDIISIKVISKGKV